MEVSQPPSTRSIFNKFPELRAIGIGVEYGHFRDIFRCFPLKTSKHKPDRVGLSEIGPQPFPAFPRRANEIQHTAALLNGFARPIRHGPVPLILHQESAAVIPLNDDNGGGILIRDFLDRGGKFPVTADDVVNIQLTKFVIP